MQKEYQKQGKPCNFGLYDKTHCNNWITRLIYSGHSSIFTESTTGAPHSGWIAEACVSRIAFHKNSLWLFLLKKRSLSNLKDFNENSFWSLSDFLMYKLFTKSSRDSLYSLRVRKEFIPSLSKELILYVEKYS